MMCLTTLWIANVILAAQPAPSPATANQTSIALPNCLVSLIDDVDLPARLPDQRSGGVLQELTAKEGLRVKTGDVLAKVDETETIVKQKAAKARLDVAIEKATNDSEVKVAYKIIEVYKAEYEESLAINQKSPGSIPPTQMRRQRVTHEKAVAEAIAREMEFKIAGLEQKVQEADVEMLANELEQRTLRAPFDGIVVELFRQQGEWVQPGDPVLRIVRMDRLRVEGFVSRDVPPAQVDGADVQISVAVPGGGTEKLSGKISFVSPLVGANRDYRVWAEVDNLPGPDGYPWLLRPGTTAEMTIQLKR
jgi:multidrug efflux pump subunit AcrA (membrane-fusion protein)